MNQMKKYSNTRATLAIALASFRSIIRSPSAVVFSLAFPLIFIVVFANIGGSPVTVNVGLAKTCDTTSADSIYQHLKQVPVIHFVKNQSTAEMATNLSKGDIDAIIDIQRHNTPPYFTLDVKYTTASAQKDGVLKSLLDGMFFRINSLGNTIQQPIAELKEATVHGREYKYIDFILPGMLGFSLLSSGVFGTAFVFLSLRITLVIKRFFATPVKRYSIVIGEALARITFALIGAAFIILIGYFAFGFTLIHGFVTFLNMMILSLIGVVIFMGFGFVVSGIAKNESSVPPIANLITLPQFLLSGTFFTISAFPLWLQPVCRILPLTFLNDAMRKVAFEGANLLDVSHQIFILLLWGIGIYALAVKTFKWE